MNYVTIETLYGPDIRYNDWAVAKGGKDPASGCLFIEGKREAKVVRSDYPHGGGGDVLQRMSFTFERVSENGTLIVQFNTSNDGDISRGFTCVVAEKEIRVLLKNREITGKAITPLSNQTETRDGEHDGGLQAGPNDGRSSRPINHEIELATLGESFSLQYDGMDIAEGKMDPPYTDNEGWVVITCISCDIVLTSFEELSITHDKEIPDWTRTRLLYEEPFGESSFNSNWISNYDITGKVEFGADSFVFRHMSNNFIRERFQSPIAIDCRIRPLPTSDFSSGITDAIVIWMADKTDGDFLEYLDELTAQGTASLLKLLPCPFYWVDFGGSNNVTTRLRKNPYRHLIRQFTDPQRLLERGKTYDVTVVQNNGFVEFWVDGRPVIRQYDETALTEGHIGVRAYCADTELLSLKIWSLDS